MVVFRNKGTLVSIYAVYDGYINHIRDLTLDMYNCLEIVKVFINSLSMEVLALSRHYEIEGALITA